MSFESTKIQVNILKQLDHENIVKYVDHIEKDGVIIGLVMDFCNGGNLAEMSGKSKSYDEVIDSFLIGIHEFLQKLQILLQITLAVEYIHKNQVVHRDIKPQNILLVEENGSVIAKLGKLTSGMNSKSCSGDFGIAKQLQSAPSYSTLREGRVDLKE